MRGQIPLRAEPNLAAQRVHRRKVSVMRMLFPAAAVILVAIVMIWPQWQSIETAFKVGFARINPDEARVLRMVKPRFSGTNAKGQPFMLTADEARRTSPTADLIFLTKPKGDVTTSSGAWVALAAENGKYSQENEILDLGGGVELFHDNGLHFSTATAQIDLKAGTADGNDTVTGNGPSIEVTGKGFELLNGGKTVIFKGKSRAVLYPQDTRKRKAPPQRLKQ